LSVTDTSFAQNDTLKIDAVWFTQFVVPKVYLDSALTLEIEAGELIQTSLENGTLSLWSDSVGFDSLLIRFYEDDDEDNFDEAWFHLAITEPNSIEDQADIPLKFALMNAYPNPFNATTIINYGLPQSGQVSLQVYNPLGQTFSTLFEGFMQAGEYSTRLTTDNLPTGLYFVRLEASNTVLTQKVILMR